MKGKIALLLSVCFLFAACSAEGSAETSEASTASSASETTPAYENISIKIEVDGTTAIKKENNTEISDTEASLTSKTEAEITSESETAVPEAVTYAEPITETAEASEMPASAVTTATAKTTAETTVKTAAKTTVKTTAETTAKTTAETAPETAAADETGYDRVTIDGTEYELTFDDEFDGTELDTTKWELCPEWQRQDFDAYWSNDMTSLDGNGNLVLTMSTDGNTYYSGAIRTRGIFEQTFGYYEIRCRLNSVPGYWAAFWLMGDTVGNEDGSGEDGTEIDIFESAYFNSNGISQTLNWDGYGAAHRSSGYKYTQYDLYKGYHTFALKWTPDEYVYYVDGKETWRTSDGGVCKAPLYVKVTTETGSFADQRPDPRNFPDSFYVDYVRVYQEVGAE